MPASTDIDLCGTASDGPEARETARLERIRKHADPAPPPVTLAIILENRGGELERKVVGVEDDFDDFDEAANLAIHEAIEDWILSPGDVIRIVETKS